MKSGQNLIKNILIRLMNPYLLDKDVSGVRVAVDVAELEDHVRVHLSNALRHKLGIDALSEHCVDVVNVNPWFEYVLYCIHLQGGASGRPSGNTV